MPYVVANGLRFHVQQLGDPTAPPVVMVHGLLSGSVASWYFGLAPVLARSRYVLMYDQRGHGLSERPLRGYTLTELAADLDDLTGPLGPCALVGHSFGGLVALRHAIDHPDRVTSVALVDSFSPASPDRASVGSGGNGLRGADADSIGLDASDLDAIAIDTVDIEGIRAWERDRRRSRERRGPSGKPVRRRRRATGEQILLGGTTVLSDVRRDSQLDTTALAGLRIPLLCAMGSASPFRNEVEALAHQLPADQCRLEVLDGGHALHVDAPTELAEAVTGFLAGEAHDQKVRVSAQGGRHG
ncbi:MAG TPA: alpha/beta hydrolase [Acidimicrobiales bacterium]|jgi:pimeloyl-ACP methyl ester carboxylesterase|nr:alpha/beta hydrolase [Acidimicrobiales bacterium]